MPDEFALPPPALMSPDAVNRGPIITPTFADTDDWSARLPPHETREVEFEKRSMSSVDENARAAPDIALKSPRVTELVGAKRYELISVGTRSLDRDTEVPVVVVYNYTDDVAIEILVDPKRGEVIDVSMTPNLPALSDAEQVRALDIVRRDGRLAETGTDVDTGRGIIVDDVNCRSPQYGHRLVDLRFAPDTARCPTAYAIVDLSTEKLVRLGLLPHEIS